MIRIEAFLCILSLLFQAATADDFQLTWSSEQSVNFDARPGDTVTFTYNETSENIWIHPTGDCIETGKIALDADWSW